MTVDTLTIVETPRLRLRTWCDEDLAPFAAMNADPRVMRHFAAVLDRDESDAGAGRIRARMAERGFGLWAVSVLGGAEFIGFVGLTRPLFETRFTPCIEIGWRLAFEHWGRGYATEAARGALAYAFGLMGLDEVVSMAVPANRPSLSVMRHLGMTYSPADDFLHPLLPEGHPLRPHVLHRLKRSEWKGGPGQGGEYLGQYGSSPHLSYVTHPGGDRA